ncbi:MAG: hypothetical protein ACOYOK_14305, partial [Pseudobdellovibrionaceae bacterium]
MKESKKKSLHSLELQNPVSNSAADQLVDTLLKDLEKMPENSSIRFEVEGTAAKKIDYFSTEYTPTQEDSKTIDLRELQKDKDSTINLKPVIGSSDTASTNHLALAEKATMTKGTLAAAQDRVYISESALAGNSLGVLEGGFLQAENLKFAQQRILQLENEVEKLRAENEELASAAVIVRDRANEYFLKIQNLEKEKSEMQDSSHTEILILKGNLQYKDNQLELMKQKVEEL